VQPCRHRGILGIERIGPREPATFTCLIGTSANPRHRGHTPTVPLFISVNYTRRQRALPSAAVACVKRRRVRRSSVLVRNCWILVDQQHHLDRVQYLPQPEPCGCVYGLAGTLLLGRCLLSRRQRCRQPPGQPTEYAGLLTCVSDLQRAAPAPTRLTPGSDVGTPLAWSLTSGLA
jgi:hypothetical protein